MDYNNLSKEVSEIKLNTDLIDTAIELAKMIYANKESQFDHSIAVKNLLLQSKITNKKILSAAILQGVLESDNISFEKLKNKMGYDIAGFVLLTTKKLPDNFFSEFESKHVNEFIVQIGFYISPILLKFIKLFKNPSYNEKSRKLEISGILPIECKIIMLADMIINLNSVNIKKPVDWSDNKLKEYLVYNFEIWQRIKGYNLEMDKMVGKIFEEKKLTESTLSVKNTCCKFMTENN